jgi:isopentenyl diphosphate isomerase/L-lactate dehydrogenase-like FMN-dependent dehydrogenase
MSAEMIVLAQPFLASALISPKAVIENNFNTLGQLRWAMFLTGSERLSDLHLVEINEPTSKGV